MVGVAVNVTAVPAQIEVEPVAIVTEGVSCPVTVIVMVFELAVVGLAQPELDVIAHDTTSPLAKPDEE